MVQNQSVSATKSIVYGAFKGMGDILSAAPVITEELNAGYKVWLLCFPNKGLAEFVDLIDFGPRRAQLKLCTLPVGSGLADFKRFFAEASEMNPELVWISPHAPRAAASWKIPLLLWLTKRLYWRKARFAGATSERLSRLFDIRVPMNRDLPLMERERRGFAMAIGKEDALAQGFAGRTAFMPMIAQRVTEAPKYDLVIHPGANAQNRSWPFRSYAEVVALIPSNYRLAVLGLPGDLEAMRSALPAGSSIDFLSGSIADALTTIAQARVVLTMDSGNVHFASVLGVRVVALFGKSDPATIIARSETVLPIYEKRFECQPCQRATCHQPEVYCMNAIDPAAVAAELLRLLRLPS